MMGSPDRMDKEDEGPAEPENGVPWGKVSQRLERIWEDLEKVDLRLRALVMEAHRND